MITGEIKARIDRVWNDFWSGGIANPLEVMEQITYLLFIRRLDELQTVAENRANRLGTVVESPVFPEGNDDGGRPYADLRWSRFKDREPSEMFAIVGERVFPFLRAVGGDGSTYAHHMRDARFTIPTPALLAKVVDGLTELPMEGRDTKGDIYEYMLGKIASAGQNGQFRTPRHIIELMVAMTTPVPKDEICGPGVRHRGLSERGCRVPASDLERRGRRGVAQTLPQQHVSRLRLRQHDVADRLHEHAAARRRGA